MLKFLTDDGNMVERVTMIIHNTSSTKTVEQAIISGVATGRRQEVIA